MLFGVLFWVFLLTSHKAGSELMRQRQYNGFAPQSHPGNYKRQATNSSPSRVGSPCLTTAREKGKCVPIFQCPFLLAQVKRQVSFLTQKYKCFSQNRQTYFCCPDNSGGVTNAIPTATEVTRPRPTVTNTFNSGTSDHKNRRLLPTSCGAQLNDKVLGGNDTKLNEYPWLALLNYRNPNGSMDFKCGGALISTRYVLTAAHCLKIDAKLAIVRLGEYDFSSEWDCKDNRCSLPPQNLGVESIKIHEQYKNTRTSQLNDIGLVRLAGMAVLTEFVNPICVPMGNLLTRNFENKELYVAGWGDTGDDALTGSFVKQAVAIRGQSQEECAKFYKRHTKIKPTQICAGGTGKDACKGDSGGPLMSVNPGSSGGVHYYVIGIVSLGADCKSPGASQRYNYGIYTRVTEYVNWIMDNLKP